MNFILVLVQLCALLVFSPLAGQAQDSYHESARNYILKYKDIAMQEQLRTGVPAAIKLAQGIYETAAGKSELCANARNHFGIKCKTGWEGMTYAYTDDAPDECFRRYSSDLQSYTDHSDFLRTNPRYKPLFALDRSDYKAWAAGLKKCGYATNPAYAQKLIQTIETFGLQQYTEEAETLRTGGTYLAYASPEDPTRGGGANQGNTLSAGSAGLAARTAAPASATTRAEVLAPPAGPESRVADKAQVTEYYVTTEKNGLRGFYAKKGDLLLEYALTHRVRYARLLEWNDLPDAPLEENMFVYLEKKRRSGREPSYTVEPGMTMQLISQEVGVQLAALLSYNKLAADEQPVPGSVLNLQGPAEGKPEVYTLRKTGREPVERRGGPEEGYIYKKDIAGAGYAAPGGEASAGPESEVPEVSDAASLLAADPDETTQVAQADPVDEPQELRRTEKRKLRKSEEVAGPEEVAEEDLTPLEKLKRHMDKNVYANQNRDWREDEASQQHAEPASPEQITTFPARRLASADAQPAGRGEQSVGGERYHTVRSGDTAFSISKRYGISLEQLRTWNNLPASMVIQKGQRLRVAR